MKKLILFTIISLTIFTQGFSQSDDQLFGGSQSDFDTDFSDDSPFGRAVVGKSIGDKFIVNAPSGSYEMKVVNVTREG